MLLSQYEMLGLQNNELLKVEQGCISLLLPRLPKLPSPSYSNGLGNLGNLGSNKEIQHK